eukprot:751763-Hanusia_phi.AAC.2
MELAKCSSCKKFALCYEHAGIQTCVDCKPQGKKSKSAQGKEDGTSRTQTDKAIMKDALKSLETDLTCPICLDLVARPVTLTECGHTFCFLCIRTNIRTVQDQQLVPSCPNCRKNITITPSAPNLMIEKCVKTLIMSKPASEQNELLGKLKESTNRADRIIKHEEDVWSCFQMHQDPLFDADDNVYRCRVCMWEIDEEFTCTNPACRRRWSSSQSMREMHVNVDDEEEDEQEEEEEPSEPESDDSIRDFINDDDDLGYPVSQDDEREEPSSSRGRRRRRERRSSREEAGSDSESDEREGSSSRKRRRGSRRHVQQPSSASRRVANHSVIDLTSSDEAGSDVRIGSSSANARRRTKRRRLPSSSSGEESEEEGSGEEQEEGKGGSDEDGEEESEEAEGEDQSESEDESDRQDERRKKNSRKLPPQGKHGTTRLKVKK